ncbi:MAG: polyphosphate polymerase domain-containing protein [Bacteroidia bacterium]|nr:polyphosphate polymerase domain-containing protein [Bacteroidia bacterium]
MPDHNNILSLFEPITLEEMDSVKLMERTDTKYVFPIAELSGILEGMTSQYRILDINNVRVQRYESLYYDTKDFLLYNKHLIGKPDRYKIRFRRYLDSSGLTFLEVKHKNNKKTTSKKRTKMLDIESGINDKAREFVTKNTPYSPDIFSPSIWVNYSRMTFVNKFSQERLTIDTNLVYKKAGCLEEISVEFPQMVIAEAKREKAATVSQFVRLVRKAGVREGSISKYCFGIYNLINEVPKNNLKPKVRFVCKMAKIQNVNK